MTLCVGLWCPSLSLLGAQGRRSLLIGVDVMSYSADSGGYGCGSTWCVIIWGVLIAAYSLFLSLSVFLGVEFLCVVLAVMKLTL